MLRVTLVTAGSALINPTHGPLGGSETALLQAAQALAGLGHQVEVFAPSPGLASRPGLTFRDLAAWPPEDGRDILIVSRFYDLLDRTKPNMGRVTALWLHDVLDRPERLASRVNRYDLIFCLSRFHLEDTARRLPAGRDRLRLTRNGLDLELIESIRGLGLRREHSLAVYASRPERGLEGLLSQVWPVLKARRPELELALCGYPAANPEAGLAAEHDWLLAKAQASPGVRVLGGLAKPEFYRLLASAGFLLYPCTFAEISCLVALEAQALGTPLVTSDRFALKETVRPAEFRAPGRPGTAEYFDAFVARVLDLAEDYPRALALAEAAGQQVRAEHDWDQIVREWLAEADKVRPRPVELAGPTPVEPPPPADGPWRRANEARLGERLPTAIEFLGHGSTLVQARLEEGPRGWLVLKAREGQGAWTALHGAYDPQAEAVRSTQGVDLAGAGLVVILGLGLGYHLEALAARLEPETTLVVIEPSPEILAQALNARDLTPILARPNLELILESDPDRALIQLGRIQIRRGFPRLRTVIHRPSLRALPQTYGRLAEGLARVAKTRLEERLIYPKFQAEQVRVLLLHGKYFLMTELRHALEGLGHQLHLILFRDEEVGASEVIAHLVQAIVDFRPDFVLTVNHLGFDRDGVLTDFLGQLRLPFASWYVDSPLLIIRHYQENRSPWGTIFLWDSDYLPELQALGYEHLHYLPLATDEEVFRPYAQAELASRPGQGLAFVANSMADPIGKKIKALNLPAGLLPAIDQAAARFAQSPDYKVWPHLEALGLARHDSLAGLDEPGRIDLEALVLWRATQAYRLANVKALAGLGPVVAGDRGWAGLLDDPRITLRPPLNYYDDLPAFYNLTAVNFNATSLQMKTGLNQRVFDGPACRAFVLTDYRAQLDGLFQAGEEYVAYRSPEEARELAAFYLAHPGARQKIAAAAHRRVLAEHTYRHRLTRLIDLMRRTYAGFTSKRMV